MVSQSLTNNVSIAVERLKEQDVRIILGNFNETWARKIFCEAYRLAILIIRPNIRAYLDGLSFKLEREYYSSKRKTVRDADIYIAGPYRVTYIYFIYVNTRTRDITVNFYV